jgi:putative transposon-encoded protein
MKIVKIKEKTEIKISNIKGFLKRKVKPFGTSARVDCPKEFLGEEVYLVILEKKNGDKQE